MNETAQAKLTNTSILVLGLDGIASTAATYLCTAGIGTIGLLANTTSILARDLSSLNPRLKILEHEISFNAHNAEDLFQQYDLVIDGLENWQDKLIASDACMNVGKALIHAGISGFLWQQYTMLPGKSACLRCLFSRIGMEDFPPPATGSGEFGPMTGMAGAFQASETIKLIIGFGASQGNEFIRFDGMRREFDTIQGLIPTADCPDCQRWFQR